MPGVPTPSWPVGNALVYTTTQAFTWYLGAPDPGGLTYDVRYWLATGTAPGVPQRTGLHALRYEATGLIPGASYYWQVRACDSPFTCSAWSSAASFEVNGPGSSNATPVVPVPSWPVGNALVYASPAQLSWYAPQAPMGTVYRVYTKTCATAACTGELVAGTGAAGFADSGPLTVTSYRVPVGGGEGIVWYLRSEVGGQRSGASMLESFRMTGGAGASTAVPSWPTGDAEMYTLTPELSWWVMGGTVGLTGYEVCWGTAPTPAATPMCSNPVVKGVRETSHVIAAPLAWGMPYYWHVRVIGNPAWSTASFVTTGAAGSLTPVIAWPTGNALIYGTETALRWYLNGASAPVDHFEVELTELGNLGGTTTYFMGAGERIRTVTGLAPGATYSWRVRASNGNAFSLWSDPAGTFAVYNPNGAVMPLAQSPARSVSLPAGAAPVLSWSLPMAPGAGQTYEVEVAANAAMTGAQRFAGIAAPSLALGAQAGGAHYWRVRARTVGGVYSAFSPVERFVTGAATATDAAPGLDAFDLVGVAPNPLRGAGLVRLPPGRSRARPPFPLRRARPRGPRAGRRRSGHGRARGTGGGGHAR